MIHSLLAIAVNDVLSEETDGFVGHLTFAGALFDGLEEFDRIFGAAQSVLLQIMDWYCIRLVHTV